MKWYMMIPIIGVGLLIIAVSVPMILGKIPPNLYYGFRVAKTMGDPEIWYAANRFCGWAYAVAGILTIAAGVALVLVPSLDPNTYTAVCLAILTVAVIVATVASFLYLRTL